MGNDSKYGQVTKEQKEYPRKLETHGVYLRTPPVHKYIDFPDDFESKKDHQWNYIVSWISE